MVPETSFSLPDFASVRPFLKHLISAAAVLNESFENPYPKYCALCKPLIEEIKEKLEKSKMLSSPALRKKYLASNFSRKRKMDHLSFGTNWSLVGGGK
ncbi:MAG: hypothetical protein AB1468_01390 [Candidatus Micrarchaeota archaeon]